MRLTIYVRREGVWSLSGLVRIFVNASTPKVNELKERIIVYKLLGNGNRFCLRLLTFKICLKNARKKLVLNMLCVYSISSYKISLKHRQTSLETTSNIYERFQKSYRIVKGEKYGTFLYLFKLLIWRENWSPFGNSCFLITTSR